MSVEAVREVPPQTGDPVGVQDDEDFGRDGGEDGVFQQIKGASVQRNTETHATTHKRDIKTQYFDRTGRKFDHTGENYTPHSQGPPCTLPDVSPGSSTNEGGRPRKPGKVPVLRDTRREKYERHCSLRSQEWPRLNRV